MMSQEIQRHITAIYNELDQYHDNKGLTEICYWHYCKHFKYNEAFQVAFFQNIQIDIYDTLTVILVGKWNDVASRLSKASVGFAFANGFRLVSSIS